MVDKNILGQTAYFPLLLLLDDELNKRKDAVRGLDTSSFAPASLAVAPNWQGVATEGVPETERSVLLRLLEDPASLSYNDFLRYIGVGREVYRRWIEKSLREQNRLVGELGDISLLSIQQGVKEELNEDVDYHEAEKQLLDRLYRYVTTLERANRESDPDKKRRLYQQATVLARQVRQLEDKFNKFASLVGKHPEEGGRLTKASQLLQARAIAGASALALFSRAIREGAALKYTHYTDVPGVHLWRQAQSPEPIDPLKAHLEAQNFWNRVAELTRKTGSTTLGLSAIEPLLRNKTLVMAFNKSDGRWYLFPARWIQRGIGKEARYETIAGSRAVGMVLPIRAGQDWVVQLFGNSPDIYESIADLYDSAIYPIASRDNWAKLPDIFREGLGGERIEGAPDNFVRFDPEFWASVGQGAFPFPTSSSRFARLPHVAQLHSLSWLGEMVGATAGSIGLGMLTGRLFLNVLGRVPGFARLSVPARLGSVGAATGATISTAYSLADLPFIRDPLAQIARVLTAAGSGAIAGGIGGRAAGQVMQKLAAEGTRAGLSAIPGGMVKTAVGDALGAMLEAGTMLHAVSPEMSPDETQRVIAEAAAKAFAMSLVASSLDVFGHINAGRTYNALSRVFSDAFIERLMRVEDLTQRLNDVISALVLIGQIAQARSGAAAELPPFGALYQVIAARPGSVAPDQATQASATSGPDVAATPGVPQLTPEEWENAVKLARDIIRAASPSLDAILPQEPEAFVQTLEQMAQAYQELARQPLPPDWEKRVKRGVQPREVDLEEPQGVPQQVADIYQRAIENLKTYTARAADYVRALMSPLRGGAERQLARLAHYAGALPTKKEKELGDTSWLERDWPEEKASATARALKESGPWMRTETEEEQDAQSAAGAAQTGMAASVGTDVSRVDLGDVAQNVVKEIKNVAARIQELAADPERLMSAVSIGLGAAVEVNRQSGKRILLSGDLASPKHDPIFLQITPEEVSLVRNAITDAQTRVKTEVRKPILNLLNDLLQRVADAHVRTLQNLKNTAAPLASSRLPIDDVPLVDLVVLGNRGSVKDVPSGLWNLEKLVDEEIRLIPKPSTKRTGAQSQRTRATESSSPERRGFLMRLLGSIKNNEDIPSNWARQLIAEYYASDYEPQRYAKALASYWSQQIVDRVRGFLQGIVPREDVKSGLVQQYLEDLFASPSQEVVEFVKRLGYQGDAQLAEDAPQAVIDAVLSRKDSFTDLLAAYAAARLLQEIPEEHWGPINQILENALRRNLGDKANRIIEALQKYGQKYERLPTAIKSPELVSIEIRGDKPRASSKIKTEKWTVLVDQLGPAAGKAVSQLEANLLEWVRPEVDSERQRLSLVNFRRALAQRLADEALDPDFEAKDSILRDIITASYTMSEEAVNSIVSAALKRLRAYLKGGGLSPILEPDEAARLAIAILENAKPEKGWPWGTTQEGAKALEAYYSAFGASEKEILDMDKAGGAKIPSSLASYIDGLRKLREVVGKAIRERHAVGSIIAVGEGAEPEENIRRINRYITDAIVNSFVNNLPSNILASPDALRTLGEWVAEQIRKVARDYGLTQEMEPVAQSVQENINRLLDLPTTETAIYRWIISPPENHPVRTKGPIAYLKEIAKSDYWNSDERRLEFRRALRSVAATLSNLLYERLSEAMRAWRIGQQAGDLLLLLVDPKASPYGDWNKYIVAELREALVRELADPQKLQTLPPGSQNEADVLHAIVGAGSIALGRLLRNNLALFTSREGRQRLRVLYELVAGKTLTDEEISFIQNLLSKYRDTVQPLIESGYLSAGVLQKFESELYSSLLLPSQDQAMTYLRATVDLVRHVLGRTGSIVWQTVVQEGMYENFDAFHGKYADKLVDDIASGLMPKEDEIREAGEWYYEMTGKEYEQSDAADAQAAFLADVIVSSPELRESMDANLIEAAEEVLELAESREAPWMVPQRVREVWSLISRTLSIPQLLRDIMLRAAPSSQLEPPSLSQILRTAYSAAESLYIPALSSRYAQVISMIGGRYHGLISSALEEIASDARAGDPYAQYLIGEIEKLLKARSAPLSSYVGTAQQGGPTPLQTIVQNIREALSLKPKAPLGIEPKSVSTIHRENSTQFEQATSTIRGLAIQEVVRRAIEPGQFMPQDLPALVERFKNAAQIVEDYKKRVRKAGETLEAFKRGDVKLRELETEVRSLFDSAVNLYVAAQLLKELAKVSDKALDPQRFAGTQKAALQKLDRAWGYWIEYVRALTGNYSPTKEDLLRLAEYWERVATNLRYESLKLTLAYMGHFVTGPETLERDILEYLKENPLDIVKYRIMNSIPGWITIPLRWMGSGLAHGYEIYELHLPTELFQRVGGKYELKESPENLIGRGVLYRLTPVSGEGGTTVIRRPVSMNELIRRVQQMAYGTGESVRLEIPGVIAMEDPRLALYHRAMEIENLMFRVWDSLAAQLLGLPGESSEATNRIIIAGNDLSEQAQKDQFILLDHWGYGLGGIKVQYVPVTNAEDGFDKLLGRLERVIQTVEQPSVQKLAQEIASYFVGVGKKKQKQAQLKTLAEELQRRIASKQHPLIFEPISEYRHPHSLLLGDYTIETPLSIKAGRQQQLQVPAQVNSAWILTLADNADNVLDPTGLVGQLRVGIEVTNPDDPKQSHRLFLHLTPWRLASPSEQHVVWEAEGREVRLSPVKYIKGQDLQPVIDNMLRLATSSSLSELGLPRSFSEPTFKKLVPRVLEQVSTKLQQALSNMRFVPLYLPYYDKQLGEWTTVVGYIKSTRVESGTPTTVLTLIQRRMPHSSDPQGVIATDYAGAELERVIKELADAQETWLGYSGIIRLVPEDRLQVGFPRQDYVPVMALYKPLGDPNMDTEVRVIARTESGYIAVPWERWITVRRQIMAKQLEKRGRQQFALPISTDTPSSPDEEAAQQNILGLQDILNALPSSHARGAVKRLYAQMFASAEHLARLDRETLRELEKTATPISESSLSYYYPIGRRTRQGSLLLNLWALIHSQGGEGTAYTRWAEYLIPLFAYGELRLSKDPGAFPVLNNLLLALGIRHFSVDEKQQPMSVEGGYADLLVERDGQGNLVYRIVLKDSFWSELIRPDNWGAYALIDNVFQSALDSRDESRLFKKPLSEVAQEAKGAIAGFPTSSTTTNPRAIAYQLYLSGVAEQFGRGLSAVVDNARALEESIVTLLREIAAFNSSVLEEGLPPGEDADKYVQGVLQGFRERLKTAFWGLRALGWDVLAQDAQTLAETAFRRGRGNTIEVNPYIEQLLQDVVRRLQQYTNAKLGFLLREGIEGSSLVGSPTDTALAKEEGAADEEVDTTSEDITGHLFNLTLLEIVQLLGRRPLDYLISMGGAYSFSVSPRELLQNIQRNTRYRIFEVFRSRIGKLDKKYVDKMRTALEEALQDVDLEIAQAARESGTNILKEFKEQLGEIGATLSSINKGLEKRLRSLKNLETFDALTAVRVEPRSVSAKGQDAPTQVVIAAQPPTMFSAAPPFSSGWGRNAIAMKDNWAAPGSSLRSKVDEVEKRGNLLAELLRQTGIWLEEPLRKAVGEYEPARRSEAIEALAFDVVRLSRLLGEILQVLKRDAPVITIIEKTLGAVADLKEKLGGDKDELGIDEWLDILYGLQGALLETVPLYAYTLARKGLAESLQQYLGFASANEGIVLRAILESYIENYYGSQTPALSAKKPTVDELLSPIGTPDSLLNAASELGFLSILLDLATQKPLVDFVASMHQTLKRDPDLVGSIDFSEIADRANIATEVVRGILRDSYWLVERGIAEIDYTPRYKWGPKEIKAFIQKYLKDDLGAAIKKLWSTGKAAASPAEREQLDSSLLMLYSALANSDEFRSEFAQRLVEAMTNHPIHLLGLEHLELENRLKNRYLLPGESAHPKAEAPETLRKLQELFWPFIPGTRIVAQRSLAVFSKRQGHLVVIPEAKALRFYAWSPDDLEQAVRNILRALKNKPRFVNAAKDYEQKLSALSNVRPTVRKQELEKMLGELRRIWLDTLDVEDIGPLVVALGSLPGVKDVDAYLQHLKQAYEADLKKHNRARSASARLYESLVKFVEEIKEYVRRNIVPVIIVRPASPGAKGTQAPTGAMVQLWGIRVRPAKAPKKYTLDFVAPRTLALEGRTRERGAVAEWYHDHPLLSEVAYNSLMWDTIVSGALAAQESFEAGRLMPGLYVYLGTHATPQGFDGVVYPLIPWSFGDEWGYGPFGATRPPLRWSPSKHPLISGAIQMMQLGRMGLGRPTEFILPAATLLNMPLEYAEKIINNAFYGTEYQRLPLKLRGAIDEEDYNTLMTALRSMGTAKRAIPSVTSLITAHRVLRGLLAHNTTPVYKQMRNKVMGFSAPLVAALADFWWEDEENPPDEFTLALGLAGLMHMLSPGAALLNFRMLFKRAQTYLKSRFGSKPGIFLAMRNPQLFGEQNPLQQFILNDELASQLNPEFIQAIETLLRARAKKARISPEELRKTAIQIAQNYAASLLAGAYNTSTWTGKLLNIIDRPAQQEGFVPRYIADKVNAAEGMVLDHWRAASDKSERGFLSKEQEQIASLFLLYADYVTSEPTLLEKYWKGPDKGIDWEKMFADFLATQLQIESADPRSKFAKVHGVLKSQMRVYLKNPNDLANPKLNKAGRQLLEQIRLFYAKIYFPAFYLAQIARFAKHMKGDPIKLEEKVRRAVADLEMTFGNNLIFHSLRDSVEHQSLLELEQPLSALFNMPKDFADKESILNYDEGVYRSIALYLINAFKRMLIHRYTWYDPEGYEGYRLVPYELWRYGRGVVLTEDTPHARIWAKNKQEAWVQMKELIKQYKLIPIASKDSPKALLELLEGNVAAVRQRAISLADVVPGQLVVLRDPEGRIYIAHPVSRSVGSTGMLVKRSTIENVVEEITRRAAEVYELVLRSDTAQNLTNTLKRWAEAFTQEAINDRVHEDPEVTQLWTELAIIMAQAAEKSQQLAERYRFQKADDLLNSRHADGDPYLGFVRALRDIGSVAYTPKEADPLIRRLLLAALLRAPRPGDAAYAVRRSNALGYVGPYNPISTVPIEDYSGFARALEYMDNSIDALLETARRNIREAAVESAARELRVLFSTIFNGVPDPVNRVIDNLKEAYLLKSRLHPKLLKAQATIGKLIGRFIFLGGIRSWLKNVFVDFPLQFLAMLFQLKELGKGPIVLKSEKMGTAALLGYTFLTTPPRGVLAYPRTTISMLEPPRRPITKKDVVKEKIKRKIERFAKIHLYQQLALEVVSELAHWDPRILASRADIYRMGTRDKEGPLMRFADKISLGILRHADLSGRRAIATYFAEQIIRRLRPQALTPEGGAALYEASLLTPEEGIEDEGELLSLAPTDRPAVDRKLELREPEGFVVLVGSEFNPYIVQLLSGIGTWAANRPGGATPQELNLYTAFTARLLTTEKLPAPEAAGVDAISSHVFYNHVVPYLYEQYGILYNPEIRKWVVPSDTFIRVVGNEVARRVEAILGSFGAGDYTQLERALSKVPGGPLFLMLVRASLPIISGSLRAVAGALAAARIKWGSEEIQLINRYTASVFSGLLASLIFAGIRGLPVMGYLLLFYELMRSIVEEDRIESSLERAKKTAQAIWQFLYDTVGVSVKTADELTQIIHDGLLTAITQVDFTRDNAVSDIGDIFLVRFIEQSGKAITEGKLVEFLRLSMGIGSAIKLIEKTPRPGRESITYRLNPLRGRVGDAIFGVPQMEYMLGIGEPAVFNEDQRAYWTDWVINHVVPGKGLNALKLRTLLIQEFDSNPQKVVELYKRYRYYRKHGIVRKLQKKFDEALSRLNDNPQLMELIVSYLKITRPQSWDLADQITNTAALIRQALSPAWDVIALRLALEHESQRWREDAPRYLQQRATASGKELAEILRQTLQQYDLRNGTNYTQRLYAISSKIHKQNRLEAYSTLVALADSKEIPEEIVLRFILAAEVYGLLGQTANRGASQIKKIKPGLQGSETVKPGLRQPRPSTGLSPEQQELIERSVEAAGAEDKLGE